MIIKGLQIQSSAGIECYVDHDYCWCCWREESDFWKEMIWMWVSLNVWSVRLFQPSFESFYSFVLNHIIFVSVFCCLFVISFLFLQCCCCVKVLYEIESGVSNISPINVSKPFSPINRKEYNCSKHFKLIERNAGNRSNSWANRPSSPGWLLRQCSSRHA